MVAFEPIARLLVVLHAAAAIVLIGAATHHVIIAVGYVRGVYKLRLGRIYALVCACAYGATFAFGAMAYPAYRWHVREQYLEANAPWAVGLFEVKEHLASLAIPLVLGTLVLSRVLDAERQRELSGTYAAMAAGVAVVAWFNVFSGLVIVLVKGV